MLVKVPWLGAVWICGPWVGVSSFLDREGR